jgi:folate-binding Fe-S cluster repair protein YgfZ
MLNYELLGGVDFKKGCYPGQEVVARSQYRGTIKRRTFLFESDGAAIAGQEIFHSADPGQPAGKVANAVPRPNGAGGSGLLAEIKLAAMNQGTLHLGSAEGPLLQQIEMPYQVTLEAVD